MGKPQKHMIRFALLTLLLLEPFALILAQDGGYAGSFQRMGFGARGMAMGNAMTAVHTEGIYGHYNPALAADTTYADRNQVDFATAVMEFDRNLHMAGVHFHLPPAAGIGVQLISASVKGIDGRTSSGYHTEMLSTNEYQLLTQFAIRFHPSVWAGIGLKLTTADYHSDIRRPVSFGGDLGLKITTGGRVTVGFTIQDLLSAYQWNVFGLFGDELQKVANQKFPIRLKSGIAYKLNEELLFAGEYEYRINPADFEISDSHRYNSKNIRLGTRYTIHERLSLRGGFRFIDLRYKNTPTLSAGFSVHLPFDRFSPSIDYAFIQEPNKIANLHVFALRLLI